MKRMMSVMLAAVLALSLAACGKTDNGGSADQSIDLKEFYNTLYQGDDAPAMEEWENNSEIVVKGNYVCLFVGENKDDMVSAFNSYGESK